MSELVRVRMPGPLWDLAARDGDGPLFVARGGSVQRSITLEALDPNGRTLWKRRSEGYLTGIRVAADGNVWLRWTGDRGVRLLGYSPDGREAGVLRPEHDDGERIGTFVVLADGFCVLWFSPQGPLRPRVARYDADGRCLWSTPVDIEGGRRDVMPALSQSLLVAGDRVAASLNDVWSGIETTFLLDAATGRPVATPPPTPGGDRAILGPGAFLMSAYGYGEFATTALDASGAVVRRWPSSVLPLVDRHGGVRGVESTNDTRGLRFVVLEPDGSVRPGPPVDYGVPHPALDEEGTAVLWSGGRLVAVSAELRERKLCSLRERPERILLLGEGRVAVAVGNELLLLSRTGLGSLDGGPWPCEDGGLAGNPVLGV